MTNLIEQFKVAKQNPSALDEIKPVFRYAKIKPTNNCNSKCITCSYWEETHKGELSTNEVISALKELRTLGVEEIMFTGGEPTIVKDLPLMVSEAKRFGFPIIGMTTNSLSIHSNKIDQLIDAGLNEIILSFEGSDLHDEIRGVEGNTKKILTNLTYFSQLRAAGTKIDVKLATTLMNRTISQIPGVVELAESHGITMFLNLIDQGTYFFEGTDASLFEIEDWSALDHLIDWLIEVKADRPNVVGNSLFSLEYARRYFKEPKQEDIPCYLGYLGVEIDANGDVFSNCWGLPPVGNLRQSSLSKIVNSKQYDDRCTAMYHKMCKGC